MSPDLTSPGCAASVSKRAAVASTPPYFGRMELLGAHPDRPPTAVARSSRDRRSTGGQASIVLALVLSERPRRTGLWFYLGALTATLAVGVIAAFVIGDIAASKTPSQPKTWVAVVDIVAAIVLAIWMVRVLRRPPIRNASRA